MFGEPAPQTTMEKTFRCKHCAEVKAASRFAAAARSFYTCRTCANRRQSERRRTDPAVRLSSRLRMQAKRGGFLMKLSVSEIRTLLESVNPTYVTGDLVTLKRVKEDAPLAPDNVAVALLNCGGCSAMYLSSMGGTVCA